MIQGLDSGGRRSCRMYVIHGRSVRPFPVHLIQHIRDIQRTWFVDRSAKKQFAGYNDWQCHACSNGRWLDTQVLYIIQRAVLGKLSGPHGSSVQCTMVPVPGKHVHLLLSRLDCPPLDTGAQQPLTHVPEWQWSRTWRAMVPEQLHGKYYVVFFVVFAYRFHCNMPYLNVMWFSVYSFLFSDLLIVMFTCDVNWRRQKTLGILRIDCS